MKKVLVVMGGSSSERDISLLSGQAASAALKQAGYKVACHDLTTDINALIETLNQEKPDVVFNALHGRYGEDGCIPGLLNLYHIPYTHSGVLASAIGMNKNMTLQLVQSIGVPIPQGQLMTRDFFITHEPQKPYIIKPNREGSSIGVFIVHSDTDREAALKEWPTDQQRLVEEYIPGREISVAVLGRQAVGAVELLPQTGFYDFHHKYTGGTTTHIIPADLSDMIATQAFAIAEQVHATIGCHALSRSDFRLDDVTNPEKPRLVFLEINTHPGLTDLSLVPELVRICRQISYEDLVSYLVENATCDV